MFRKYNWLVGVSIDGPEEINDLYRFNKQGRGTWKKVMQGIELLQREKVDFNVLCVLSQANVEKPKELYRFFRGLGIDLAKFESVVEKMAADAITSGSPGNNPRKATLEDIVTLYRSAL